MRYRRVPVVFTAGLLLNISGYSFNELLKEYFQTYLFIDSTGTLLSAAVLGPFYGAVTGLVSNLIMGLFYNPVNIPFGIVSIFIGLTAGLVYKKFGILNIRGFLISLFSIAFVTAMTGAVVAYLVFDGVTGSKLDLKIISLLHYGYEVLISSFLVRFPVNIIDKGISLMIVLIILSMTPRRLEND